jgi:hypothetical protein
MMSSWWWVWMAFMFVFLISPVSYGWGYRGWGPPYPRYVQRRRGLRAPISGGGTFDHHAWGRGGDFLWLVLAIGMVWVVAAMFWPLHR